jgi:hypothetical protein
MMRGRGAQGFIYVRIGPFGEVIVVVCTRSSRVSIRYVHVFNCQQTLYIRHQVFAMKKEVEKSGTLNSNIHIPGNLFYFIFCLTLSIFLIMIMVLVTWAEDPMTR